MNRDKDLDKKTVRCGLLAALALFALPACTNGASPAGNPITGFALLTTATDETLTTTSLTDGAVLDAGGFPAEVHIRAETLPEFVGRVRFTLGDRETTDDRAPYTLRVGTLAPGQYSLSAAPYSGPGASSASGTARRITFDVSDKP